METPAKQAPIASSEIVMLIRKLRWVGLEEKAEQLERVGIRDMANFGFISRA